MAILEADDLFRFFHPGDAEVRALRGASLSLERGETIALIGPSGSGKSTMLACLAGLDQPDGGMVRIGGAPMSRRPEPERAKLRAASIGFLAQANNLFDHLSVAENIRLQAGLRGAKRDDVRDLLGRVGLSERGDAMPAMLSGGESARAGLAVALAADPPILLADEPTAEVDAETERHLLGVLEERRANGGAAIIATHSAALAAHASRVVSMVDGRIVEAGRADIEPASLHSPPHAVDFVAGRRASVGSPLIVVRAASRSFEIGGQRVEAVRSVSLSLHPRHRVGLVGPSGSGKSTLLNLLARLDEPSSGTVSWPGLDARRPLRPLQIGFVFQSPSLIPSLSAFENVRLPLDIAGVDARSAMAPEEALERLNIADLSAKLPDQLSGGQMQRVALARALTTRPKVLLADEPTGQLDRKTGRDVMDALILALEGTDTGLVIATHDPLIAGHLAECWRMRAGELIDENAKDDAA
jgi:ABC-type lipoprotein export system ATPase subunit